MEKIFNVRKQYFLIDSVNFLFKLKKIDSYVKISYIIELIIKLYLKDYGCILIQNSATDHSGRRTLEFCNKNKIGSDLESNK